ncbi:bacteriocin cleavage/export ABC transporter [Philodulcilactobacillus myokoensis]|uniref:Bacteriocin cleavage/export ABC transporter n=1 Tax=Philodulcilactobacillus myokoensis TaxID=2929573 RepID=A0A9W6AZW8_9LACO|nr:peptide cleavage/export ABC transporter [Philodulcilactobacillus myokoensis]GLB46427.1 bacteriocin cleavage/export ABC transporter [Philodulcilactobacillus myokoensis]
MFFYKYYVPQVDERDCGVAALATILKFYHSRYSLAKLRQLAKTNNEGTTALGLVKAAQKTGLKTEAVKADMSIFNKKNLKLPFIVHVLKDGKYLHYYVILKNNKNDLIIADPDPSDKIKKMSKENFAKEWSGVALFMKPSPAYVPKKEKKNGLLSYIPLLFKQRKLILEITITAFIVTIISIIGSYYFQELIDSLIPKKIINTISIISIGLITAYIFQEILTFVQNYLLTIFGQELSVNVILNYIKHVFSLPMSFFSTRRTGEIVSRFTDASKIIDALASTIVSIFLDLFIIIILSIVLSMQSSLLFMVSLILIPLYATVIYVFFHPFEKYNQKSMENNSKLSSSIIEDIHGIETIKSLNVENESYNKIYSEFIKYLKSEFTYSKLDFMQQAMKTTIQLTVNVLILWIGSRLVIQNELSIGQLITYNALLSYFTNPIQNIINLQTKLQMARVANNRLNEIYLVKSEFKNKRSISKISKSFKQINMKNVSFKYGFGKNVLSNINLIIPNNCKTTIVGMSGSGKTTLVKLLSNFFTPQEGKIFIDNKNINDINKHTIKKFINYLPQEPYVFNGTIRDNLLLGSRESVTNEEIMRACKIAEISHDIESMPLKYNTELSENGSMLSGGQKQRISIARSLLTPAKVLIFDESTSSLDTITENKIVNNLLKLKNKTIIFVAHRLNIAKKTNNIVVIDKGKIVEQGSHEELINKNGIYKHLINE